LVAGLALSTVSFGPPLLQDVFGPAEALHAEASTRTDSSSDLFELARVSLPPSVVDREGAHRGRVVTLAWSRIRNNVTAAARSLGWPRPVERFTMWVRLRSAAATTGLSTVVGIARAPLRSSRGLKFAFQSSIPPRVQGIAQTTVGWSSSICSRR
jgi:hypothetical protein